MLKALLRWSSGGQVEVQYSVLRRGKNDFTSTHSLVRDAMRQWSRRPRTVPRQLHVTEYSVPVVLTAL